MSERKYAYVSPAELSSVWLQCQPLFEKAVKYSDGSHTVEDYRRLVQDGKYQLCIQAEEGRITMIIVVCLNVLPRFTSLFVHLLAGSTKNALDNFMKEYCQSIVDWSRTQGATKVQMVSHPAFSRLISRYGYKVTHHMLEMDV